LVDQWIASDNMWLQRCPILFQLKYKEHLDTELLSHVIESLIPSEEFFINKAIGWVLRQYSRTNPQWVTAFVASHELSALSQKEALRLMGK
jgi:3-methyladenine DNA glycosylase AlkD